MRCIHAMGVAVILAIGSAGFAQAPPNLVTGNGAVGGVAISTDGFLQMRQTAPPAHPASRPAATQARGPGRLLYVSLPRVLLEWKNAKDAGRAPPADVLDLHGLERIQDVFIFPAVHDIVLAGPSEPVKADNPLEPEGSMSGRPVVELEDLIVAMRAVAGTGAEASGRRMGRADFFGCTMDPPENLQSVWNDVMKKYGSGSRTVLQQEMTKALGPQPVRLFGVPDDARMALAMVSADYRLKRMCMGLEPLPAGIGNALGTQDAAVRIWFEPAYDPLLVSSDGDAYELRGPRLKVLAGPQEFNPTGATAAQKQFVEKLSAKIPEVAERIDAVADLQNVTDCLMLAALIRHDRLEEKAGVDFSWLLSAAQQERYQTAKVPTPKTAQTIVHISGNVIAQGGVAVRLAALWGTQRENDPTAHFAAAVERPEDGWFADKTP